MANLSEMATPPGGWIGPKNHPRGNYRGEKIAPNQAVARIGLSSLKGPQTPLRACSHTSA